MRSNIARTCCSGSVPARDPLVVMRGEGSRRALLAALELGQERDHVLELLRVALLEGRERGHGRGGVDQRPGDRLPGHAVRDVGELRPGAVVAVLADLVAGPTPR